jgi:hypothetical protein
MPDLVASRAPDTVLRHESEWLFPGRKDIHQPQVLRRLRVICVKTRQGRNTALFALAQQLPAGQLTRMLGATSAWASPESAQAEGAGCHTPRPSSPASPPHPPTHGQRSRHLGPV